MNGRRQTEPRPVISLKIRDRELHRRLKVAAAQRGVPIQVIVERALRLYLEGC